MGIEFPDPALATTAEGVDRIARALFGEDVSSPAGTLHVTAVDAEHRVIAVGPHAPPSPLDFFVLHLARARADAIVVSGAVLRAEPELRYGLRGPGESERGLLAWRREVVGLTDAPRLLVLTRGALSLDHPALLGWARPQVYTTPEGGARLAGRGVPVHATSEPSLRGALQHLEGEGARSIAIEAGPSATAPLYTAQLNSAPLDTARLNPALPCTAPPTPVRELWLSVFEGELDPRGRVGRLPSPAALAAAGLTRRSAAGVSQPSGPWRFERWTAP